MRRAAALALTVLGLLLVTEAAARPWAWLGVRIRDLSEHEMDEISGRHGILEGYGVLIVDVLEDTPAARAGLRRGDVIVAVGEWQVTEVAVLQRMIGNAPIGVDARVTVLRENGREPIAVRLARMPRDAAGDRVAAGFGFAIRAFPQGGGVEDPGTDLPAISAIGRSTPAERAGLEVGDVILEVADRTVATRQGAREALGDIPLDRPLRLTVRRLGRLLAVTLPAPAP